MEMNEIASILLALYGAALSTYLAIKQLSLGKPKLTFSHDFTNLAKAQIMEISAFNPSSNPIHLLKVEYFLGSSSMPKKISIGENTVIEPYHFVKVSVPIKLEDKYESKVKRFRFSLASGQTFEHTLQHSLEYEVAKFRAERLSQVAEFGFEKSSDEVIVSAKKVDEAMLELEKSQNDCERLIQEAEELFANSTNKQFKSDS
ncbi:TPA: hypothetical protein ACGF8U_003563 [Vibrio cholerae]